MTNRIRMTIVIHAAIDIAVPADALWALILDDYVEARKFRALADITPVDDAAAPLGGHHILARLEDGSVDERIIHFTERDDGARRLSVFADYLTTPERPQVHATYQAQDISGGSRFAIDCHAGLEIDAPPDADRAEMRDILTARKAIYHEGLMHYLRGVKVELEEAGPETAA